MPALAGRHCHSNFQMTILYPVRAPLTVDSNRSDGRHSALGFGDVIRQLPGRGVVQRNVARRGQNIIIRVIPQPEFIKVSGDLTQTSPVSSWVQAIYFVRNVIERSDAI